MQTTGSSTVAVPNADPTCYYVQYSGGNPTGYRYQVAVNNTGTLSGYTPISPAIGVEQQSTTADPTSNTDVTTVYASGTHSDNQVQGGMTNTLADQTQSLMAFIQNAKSQATKFVDLTPGVYAQNAADPGWGNPDTNPPTEAIVFASGSYVDGVWQSGDLHLGGTFKGAGILVVEVDDPAQAKLIMDGSAEWVGEVIVYSHKAPTGNNAAPLTFVGGGNALHIIGGAMVLVGSGSALTRTVVKSAGQSDLMYDSKAIDQANKSYPAGMSVRSWRKLAP
jgi:hypothetical protein